MNSRAIPPPPSPISISLQDRLGHWLRLSFLQLVWWNTRREASQTTPHPGTIEFGPGGRGGDFIGSYGACILFGFN